MNFRITRTIKLCFLALMTAGFFAGLTLIRNDVHAYSSVPPSSRTGAPAYGSAIPAELTCATSGCHTGAGGANNLNDGQGTFNIALPATYTPGQVYTITISLKRGASMPKAGFQLMAVDSDGIGETVRVGTLDNVIPESPFTTIRQAAVGDSFRRYMIHISSVYPSTVAGSGQADWQVKWTAPATNVGRITFYAAGNAANGNGNPSGDFIYTTSASVRADAKVDVVTQNSASGTTSDLTPNGIGSAYGIDLSTQTTIATDTDLVAPGVQLPTTLSGTTVGVKDSAGTTRSAALFYVSPNQINYQIPNGTASGAATVTVTNSAGGISTGTVNIASVSPGIFTVLQNGTGLAAAQLQRVTAANVQSFEDVAQFTAGSWSAIPIDWKNQTDSLYLVLYGTGIRNVSALTNVSLKIGNAAPFTTLPAIYANSQNFYAGLDQVNILLPRTLVGSGLVDAVLTVDGKAANTVKLNFK